MRKARIWLKLVSVLLILGLILPGCSGAGSGSSAPAGSPTGTSATGETLQIPLSQSTGTVNTQEIGGTGLKVESAWQDPASVSPNGFTIKTSAEGAQLLFVSDSQSALRGMTLSIPQPPAPSSRATEPLNIDAQSTALSLCFLVPGIGTADPVTAKALAQKLQGLSSFSKLVDYLKTALPGKSLPEILEDPQYQQALGGSIKELYSSIPVTTPKKAALGVPNKRFSGPTVAQKNTFVTITLKDKESSDTKATFEIKNAGKRYVNIYRELIFQDSQKEPLVEQVASEMSGPPPLDTGLLLEGILPLPTTKTDVVADLQNVVSIRYWIAGPGIDAEPLPSNVQKLYTTAEEGKLWILTNSDYRVGPGIGLILAQAPKNLGLEKPGVIGSQRDAVLNAKNVQEAAAKKDQRLLGAAVIKTMLLALAPIVTAIGVSTTFAATIAAPLAIAAVIAVGVAGVIQLTGSIDAAIQAALTAFLAPRNSLISFTQYAPQITGINPATGTPGTSISITGADFGSSAWGVTFNGTLATVTSWTDTQITCKAPFTGSYGPASVVVTSANGLSGNAGQFRIDVDLTGIWDATAYSVTVGKTTAVYSLRQSGPLADGTYTVDGQMSSLSNNDGTNVDFQGAFDGKAVLFRRDTGMLGTIQYWKLTLQGSDKLTGTYWNEGPVQDSGTLEAVRRP